MVAPQHDHGIIRLPGALQRIEDLADVGIAVTDTGPIAANEVPGKCCIHRVNGAGNSFITDQLG